MKEKERILEEENEKGLMMERKENKWVKKRKYTRRR